MHALNSAVRVTRRVDVAEIRITVSDWTGFFRRSRPYWSHAPSFLEVLNRPTSIDVRVPTLVNGTLGVRAVVVQFDKVTYLCRQDRTGWRCGHCLRGHLGPEPISGGRCELCAARVG